MGPLDLVFVGGFLGAGKTTLLAEAARALAQRGRRVGLVTNDQAPQLFDTAVLAGEGPVAEVAGSCFCCDFDGLIAAVEQLRGQGADLVLAEPVGSCTDLAATLIRPIEHRFGGEIRVAPLTVLADPRRAAVLLEPDGRTGLHEATAYIYRLQLEEADRILLTRGDVVRGAAARAVEAVVGRALPGRPVDWVAAPSGAGVEQWIDAVLAGGPAGTRRIEVDYDRYALGEAVLGWLNATVWLDAADGAAPERLIGAILAVLREEGLPVGHLKARITGLGFEGRAQCTTLEGGVEGSASGGSGPGSLVLNARVQCEPVVLQRICERALASLLEDGGAVLALSCFSPGYPRPTWRDV